MVHSKDEILANAEHIAKELMSWATTFDAEIDDEGERTEQAYDYIVSLAEKLQNNSCSEDELLDIDFHIWQINYNEEKIKL